MELILVFFKYENSIGLQFFLVCRFLTDDVQILIQPHE